MFAGLATGPFSPQFGRFLAYFLVFLGISVLLSLSKDSADPELRDSLQTRLRSWTLTQSSQTSALDPMRIMSQYHDLLDPPEIQDQFIKIFVDPII